MNASAVENRLVLCLNRSSGKWYYADVTNASMVEVDAATFRREIALLKKGLSDADRQQAYLTRTKEVPIVMQDSEGRPVTHPKNRGEMLRAADREQWEAAENAEILKNQDNRTLELTEKSLQQLISEGYEIVGTIFANTIKSGMEKGQN